MVGSADPGNLTSPQRTPRKRGEAAEAVTKAYVEAQISELRDVNFLVTRVELVTRLRQSEQTDKSNQTA